jgi:hypothetical protein
MPRRVFTPVMWSSRQGRPVNSVALRARDIHWEGARRQGWVEGRNPFARSSNFKHLYWMAVADLSVGVTLG